MLVYATTVHNINEYHALTILPHYITDGSQIPSDSTYPNSSVSGDIELTTRLPAPSFSSRVRSLLAASAGIIRPSRQLNEFQPVLGYDPLETELDSVPTSSTTNGAAVGGISYDSNIIVSSDDSRSINNSNNNSVQPSPLSSHTQDNRRRRQTVGKNSLFPHNIRTENKQLLTTSEELRPEDATLSLLAVLEQLHCNSEMSADIADIRQVSVSTILL